jgi:hypothetical protein
VSGSRTLLTPTKSGGISGATRGTIFYAFTKSRSDSVFSCETQLTWQLSLSLQNGADLWKVQQARIRISMPLHTPLSWLNSEIQIGATLSLIRNTNRSQYCDYCKGRWGKMKDGSWHINAQRPAEWIIISESPTRRGKRRFYCQPCANEVQNWANGTFWSLKEQLDFAIKHYAEQEKLNVELA